MRYVIDTTLLIDYVRGRAAAGEVIQSLFAEPNDLLICEAVVAEALSACSDDERAAIAHLIDALEYVALPPDAAAWAGESRRRGGRQSRRTLGDALIAAAAWFSDATVVTRNPQDFEAQGVRVLAYG